ncbi:MAG: Crp/Fnr family transcriptional regulator [Bacteroidales bacterium]|nr:Crp/Fnr family transcriptional regulator [Bacteroidales bacterium]
MQDCKNCVIRSKAVDTLSEEELHVLMENCAEATFSAGEYIIKEGLLSSHVGYLKSGLAAVNKKGVKGIEQILKIVLPKNYIGLQTVLFEKTNQYAVKAINECIVCFIDNLSFKKLISRNPQFDEELLLFLCNEELTYFDRFVNWHQKQINSRVADIILFFSENINNQALSFEIPLSRFDLSSLISTTRESLTRSIKELSEIKAVKVKGKKFQILDPELLKKISQNGHY